MRRSFWIVGTLALLLGGVLVANAWVNVYKWIKDRHSSSDQVLKRNQTERMVSLEEKQTLEVIRSVMTEDLYLALAEYHKTQHQQDGETTPDTVMPEDLVGREEVVLSDEDYCFLIEVKVRPYGNRTRVSARAYPLYRVHDRDAESEANNDHAGSSVDIKVHADENQAVGVGPIFVMPVPGVPGHYGVVPLVGASDRAAKLVRSFFYLLDLRANAAAKSPGTAFPAGSQTVPEAAPPAKAAVTDPGRGDAAVENKVTPGAAK